MRRALILMLAGGVAGAGATAWFLDTGRNATSPVSARNSEAEGNTGNLAGRGSEPEALAEIAAFDPLAAIERLVAIPDIATQRSAAGRIAAAWVAIDPLAALSSAGQLPPGLRTDYLATLDSEWARLDAGGYLAYVTANPGYLEALIGHGHYEPGPILERSGGIRMLLASDPVSVVALADNLSSRLGATLKTLALGAYAEQDPYAAIALVEQMQVGETRDAARAAVGTGFARTDPEGALAWAASLSPPPATVLGNVLNVVAQTDIARAVDLAVTMPWSGNPQFPPINAIVLEAGNDSRQALIAADTLLASNAPRRDYRLGILLQRWGDHDAESVIDWLSAHAASLSGDAVSGAAYGISLRDPVTAANLTDRVPYELRAAWIERVAQGYATSDGASALEWIADYEGQEGYDIGMRLVLTHYASDDPAAAARAVSSVAPEIQLGAAGVVADQWARRDGAPAADWAIGLSDPTVRAAAVPEAVGAWMSRSSQQAEDWTLQLPAGGDRDLALRTLIQGRLFTDAPRESYSTNPTATLIAQISNPAMRREAEDWFE